MTKDGVYLPRIREWLRTISPCATVHDSLITEGCEVYGNVNHSILFAGVIIEEGAKVESSVIMPGSIIRRGAVVQRAIVAENAILHKEQETIL